MIYFFNYQGNAGDRTRTAGLEGLSAIHYTTNPFIWGSVPNKSIRIQSRGFAQRRVSVLDTGGIRTRACITQGILSPPP